MKLAKLLGCGMRKREIYAVPLNATLREAAKKITEKRCGCLMVFEPGTEPKVFTGIVTKLDLLGAMSRDGSDMDHETVEKCMTGRMIVATAEDDMEYVMNVMVRHRISYIPVIDGKSIAGIISMDDILRELNAEQEIQLHWVADMTGSTSCTNVF